MEEPIALEWTDEKVAQFWNWQGRFAQTYFTFQFGAQIASQLRRPLAGRTTVLDYGCGPGFLIPHLVRLGKKITATDFSVNAIAAANAAFKDLAGFHGAKVVADLLNTEARFDAAVSIEVIEHLNDAHLESFFENLRRLLRPEGTAIITTPNEEDLNLSMVYCADSNRVFHRWQHVRSWSAEGLATAMTAHGFVVETTYTTDFSKARFGDPVGAAKRLVKAALGRPEKRPHLVCIGRPSS